jgi:hypothetical protein
MVKLTEKEPKHVDVVIKHLEVKQLEDRIVQTGEGEGDYFPCSTQGCGSASF